MKIDCEGISVSKTPGALMVVTLYPVGTLKTKSKQKSLSLFDDSLSFNAPLLIEFDRRRMSEMERINKLFHKIWLSLGFVLSATNTPQMPFVAEVSQHGDTWRLDDLGWEL